MEKDKQVTAQLVPTGNPPSLFLKGTTHEFFGKTGLVGSEGYTGALVIDPKEEWKFHVWCGRVADNYAADTVRVIAFVTIDYDVVFTEPKPLGAS